MCLKENYTLHCVKIVRIRSYSGPYFPALGLNATRYSKSALHLTHKQCESKTYYFN